MHVLYDCDKTWDEIKDVWNTLDQKSHLDYDQTMLKCQNDLLTPYPLFKNG